MTIVGEVAPAGSVGGACEADVADTLAHLFEAYAVPVEGLCRRRLRDVHLAEDACHEALLRAAVNADRLDPGAPVWPWLATIAANVCTDMQRRVARHTVVAEPPDRPTEEPHDVAARQHRTRLVEDALSSLPEPARSAVYLRDLAGWSYDDIAAAQGRSTASVRSTLFRGRRLLRRQVEELAARRRAEWPLPAVIAVTWRSLPSRFSKLRERVELTRARVGVRLDPMLLGGEMIGREVLTHASVGVILAVGATVPALVGALHATGAERPAAIVVVPTGSALDAPVTSAPLPSTPSARPAIASPGPGGSVARPDEPEVDTGGVTPELSAPPPQLAEPTVPAPPSLAAPAPDAPEPVLPDAPTGVDVAAPAPDPVPVVTATLEGACTTATAGTAPVGCPAPEDAALVGVLPG